ncbi:MAG: HDOD domain-containing protein [Gammaproteobacteria bacterium]|nr:MAG: HDOD domain-containing protein [Gammaproteobacteria bacterium]
MQASDDSIARQTTPLSFEKTQELLRHMVIPSAPAVLLELHEAMQADDPDIGQIADAVGRDAGIAAMVLRTVNSPFFGLRHKVASIRQATALLGLLNIGNIVAGLALRRALEHGDEEPPPHFWESPANVAMIAAMLAQRYGGMPPDEAYLLGLFRDAGEVIMAQRFPDYPAFLRELREQERDQVAEEERRYATNHAQISYIVSTRWGLPRHVRDIILRHHEAEDFLREDGGVSSEPRTLMAVLKMAEHIDAVFWGRKEDAEWERIAATTLNYLGVSSLEFLDVTEDMVDLLIAGQG